MSTAVFAQYPALAVEIGAVLVIASALLARGLSHRFGIPSIVTLLACGLFVGPSALRLVSVNLTDPATRALLSLCVVIVLFEATLRMDLRRVPKATLAWMVGLGALLVLIVLPRLAEAFGFSPLIGELLAGLCVVTGPTVVGPLLNRLRLRPHLAHLLETEGLVLDALGVVVVAAIFASVTTRAPGLAATSEHIALTLVPGLGIGVIVALIARRALAYSAELPVDIGKLLLLLFGFGAYAIAEAVAHESGLAAVVACGLFIDLGTDTHERALLSFKEDLSMLALATVFVVLASQIQVRTMLPLVVPGLAISGALILIRILAVGLASLGSQLDWRERLFSMTVFPRGIVAVSLGTYYATQLPAWGFRGGSEFAGLAFMVVILTVVVSASVSIVAASLLRVQMPRLLMLGITEASVELARRLEVAGNHVVMADREKKRVELARAQGFSAMRLRDNDGAKHQVRASRFAFIVQNGERGSQKSEPPVSPDARWMTLEEAAAFADSGEQADAATR